MPQPKGKPIGFHLVHQGSTTIRLKDGNYLKIQVVVNKVLKDETKRDAQGYPAYTVNTSTAISVWTPEEVKELEE